jgi:signal transduction histidine kinase/CheY-like chemotaxis protein
MKKSHGGPPNTRTSIDGHPEASGSGQRAGNAEARERRQLERRRLEQERDALLLSERAARLEAERVSRVKDEFVATLSHELRTPLHAILGWTHVLMNPSSREVHLEAGLRAIERNARAQARMIDDLLDMSRIISGKVRLDVQRIALAPLIVAAVESIRPAADAKAIELKVALDAAAGPIHGDPNRLQQVIWNLLSNAVKFTPPGGRVVVSLERSDAQVTIAVSDSGEGIAPQFLPYLFERFRQADASTTRQHGGLGLGLSIIKQLVELHGGAVGAESAGPGQGSTFRVSLPIRGPALEPAPTPPSPPPQAELPALSAGTATVPLAGLRVLVVDDVTDARELMQVLLQDQQASVISADSGAQALELLREQRPDLILCDIGMPQMDGYQLIRALRALPPEEGGTTPALAITAFARPEDRRRAIESGYDGHLAKPVAADALLAAIDRLGLANHAGTAIADGSGG